MGAARTFKGVDGRNRVYYVIITISKNKNTNTRNVTLTYIYTRIKNCLAVTSKFVQNIPSSKQEISTGYE